VSSGTDTLGFVEQLCTIPDQVGEARAATAAVDLSSFAGSSFDHVVVLGVGGSAVAGDVLAAVAGPTLPIPVVVVRDFAAPAFVGPRSLVFAISYSGGSAETLSATRRCLEVGAAVVGVTSGGELAHQLSAVSGGRIAVVASRPGRMPRAAVGALVTPLFAVLGRLGLAEDVDAVLDAAVEQLVRRRAACGPEVEGSANPARELARAIDRTVPVIYGSGPMGAVAAMRWKCDVNENAKSPAWWSAHPELDHNEVCAWGQHGDVTRQLITLVELRHDHEHPAIESRVRATHALADEAVHQILTVRAEGDGPLAQLLDLVTLGDWTSTYLALRNDVDPGPIDAISQLKALSADRP
jgi:glucose/mannose-6-phosphate isomerase